MSNHISNHIKSIFIPYDGGSNNPYLSELAGYLTEQKVQVEGAIPKIFFLHTAIKQKPKIIHLHWLHPFFTKSTLLKSLIVAAIFLFQLFILRLIGVKIVWTVHNLKNHNNNYQRLDRIGTAAVARLAHAIIAHCEAAKQEIITTFNLNNGNKINVVPHGNYINCYENKVSRDEARQILGIPRSKLVLLFFGLIRPYKGVLELVDTFNHLANDETHLIIVGKVWNDSLEQAELLHQKTSENNRIKFIPGFVPDDKIQLYMNACDIVVFPYRDILTSGAVLLAISFGRPCIAPRKGCIGEVLDDAGAFLYNPDSDDGLLQAIKMAIEKQAELPQMGKHNYILAQKYSWKRVAEMTLEVYQWCLNCDTSFNKKTINNVFYTKQINNE